VLTRLAGPQLLGARLAIFRAKAGDYPASPEEVAFQLTRKILKAERKVRASEGRGTQGTEDERQELYACCLEATKGQRRVKT
jgi:hypothetical protein